MGLSIFGGLRPFRPKEAARDALAGVTLASMNIPQVLGYTRIAGTPVVTGLYTVLLPLVAFAIFGSSRHLVVAAELGDRSHFLQFAVAYGAAREREIHGAGRYGGAPDRWVFARSADLQTGLPGRFPFAHGADRISHRRRVSGRHRDARRHVRCDSAFASHAHSGSRNTMGLARAQSSNAGAVGARGRLHPARPPLCSTLPGLTGCGNWNDCRERLVSLRRTGHCGYWPSPRGIAVNKVA